MLAKCYIVPKRSYPDYSRIASVYLPETISDADLTTFATEYEKLTTTADGGDVATTGAKVWGITQSVYDIQAKLRRDETQDLTDSPYGANGYLFLADSGTPGIGCIRQQPLTLEGFNPLFTIPSGYPPAGELHDQIAHFAKKWGTVLKRTAGVLEGVAADGFELTKLYDMH